MPAGTITPVDPRSPLGAAPQGAAATATDGDNIPMKPGRTYLVVVHNASVAGITIDINDPNSGSSATPEYNDVPIGAGASRAFRFDRPEFGAVPTANIHVLCSAVTSVTIDAFGPLDGES